MDFIDQLRLLSSQVDRLLPNINTEEATKHSLVMPFLKTLGYDVFDPTEVVPEFTADVGTKKGEKVDYAIYHNGELAILLECKSHTCNLDEQHASQLFRYFGVTSAKFGILTNGIIYRFFTDIEETNKMDPKPFFEFNILDVKDVETLKRFSKSGFSTEENFGAAIELKYTREIKKLIAAEFSSPSEALVKIFAKQVHPGMITPSKLAQFTDITKRAYHQLISDRISERLQSVMQQEVTAPVTDVQESLCEENDSSANDIVTTDEEREAFLIVRSILREFVDIKRIVMRDAKSYCSILFDDNNRKPICRLLFNTANKYIVFLSVDRKEERFLLSDLDDLYKYSENLKTALFNYYTPEQSITV